jgi:hypothetical protein
VGRSRNIIIVDEIEQLDEVFRLSLIELERRCKLEYLERASHLKYLSENSKSMFPELAQKLCEKSKTNLLKNLINYMKFHSSRRMTLTKKCFTLWLILKYENSLQFINH